MNAALPSPAPLLNTSSWTLFRASYLSGITSGWSGDGPQPRQFRLAFEKRFARLIDYRRTHPPRAPFAASGRLRQGSFPPAPLLPSGSHLSVVLATAMRFLSNSQSRWDDSAC